MVTPSFPAPRQKAINFMAGVVLTAATTAARTIFTAIAIVAYDIQFNHGFHLLSNRRLSIDLGKKIGVQQAHALQSHLLMTFTNFSVVTLSGANLIMI